MKRASSELLLLDTNVLFALAWPNHQFHSQAEARLSGKGLRWATCAITQIGFIRLSSNPRITTASCPPSAAAAMLQRLTADSAHVFIDSCPSAASPGCREAFAGLIGHKQVTDAYLRQIAVDAGAVFLTFDARFVRSLEDDSGVELISH